jgi:chromatin segregation and condensation protein Rec8/ScpA/Scc1 (kleisin family)
MAGYESRQALIALFLGLLEMVRLRAILLRQKDLFTSILVHRHKRFEEIMSGASYDMLQEGLEESLG